MKFKFPGSSFEWVSPSPFKAPGGALIIMSSYFYILLLKEDSPNCTSIRPHTKPACMELKRSCFQWVACSQERKWRAEAHVLCALVLFTEWRRKWQPTPIVLPGKSHGQRSLASHSPWGHKESDTTEQLCTQRGRKAWSCAQSTFNRERYTGVGKNTPSLTDPELKTLHWLHVNNPMPGHQAESQFKPTLKIWVS